MRRIAVINQKGGVGKTTSCCNIGANIAAAGHRVLLLDLDPQAHLTMHLGFEPESDQPSIYNVLTDNVPLADASVPVRENLTLVPSHIDLAAAEMELVSIMGREVILRDAVRRDTREFDYLLIDCPPSLGVLTINGLAAVDEIIIPMQPHFLALQGVGKLLETIDLVKTRINPELSVTGIILCMYEAGTRLAGEISADLAAFLDQHRGSPRPWAGAVVYQTIVRRNIKLAESPSHGQTIAEYAPQSNGANDYAALTAEILGVAAATQRTKQSRARKEAGAHTSSATTTRCDSIVDATDSSIDEAPAGILEPALAAIAAQENDPISAYDAGDRVALGPDPVISNLKSEISDALPSPESQSSRLATASVPHGGPVATGDSLRRAAIVNRKSSIRSIPVLYEEEAAQPASAGAHRE